MNIGEYVGRRRQARELSIEDVIAGAPNLPAARAWLGAVEGGTVTPSEEELFQLWYAGGGFFWPDVAVSLVRGETDWSICRVCACTEFDACPEGCGWASPDQTLCTACEGKEA